MSYDLMVVREKPLSWSHVVAALDALQRDGLVFWTPNTIEHDRTAYFRNVGRVWLTFEVPELDEEEDDDDDDDESSALAAPHVIVTSRSGAWPWIDFLAVELANALHARVFNPQTGEFYERTEPEYDWSALERLHEKDLRERNPELVTTAHATLQQTDHRVPALPELVQKITATGLAVLAADQAAPVETGQVNWSTTFRCRDGSTFVVNCFKVDDGPYDVNVEGPAASPVTDRFLVALAERLGTSFVRIDEYRYRRG